MTFAPEEVQPWQQVQQQQTQQQQLHTQGSGLSQAGSPGAGPHPGWRLVSSPKPTPGMHMDHHYQQQQQHAASVAGSPQAGSVQSTGIVHYKQQQQQQEMPSTARGESRPRRTRRLSRARSMPAPASIQWVEGEDMEDEEALALQQAAQQYYQHQQQQEKQQRMMHQGSGLQRSMSPQPQPRPQPLAAAAAAVMAHRPPSRLSTVSGDGVAPQPPRHELVPVSSQQSPGASQPWLQGTSSGPVGPTGSPQAARHMLARPGSGLMDSPRHMLPAAHAAHAAHSDLLRSSLERVHSFAMQQQAAPAPAGSQASTPRRHGSGSGVLLSPFAVPLPITGQASGELPMASPDSRTSQMSDAQLCSVVGPRMASGAAQQQSAGVHGSHEAWEELPALSPFAAAQAAGPVPAPVAMVLGAHGSGHLLHGHQHRPASRLSASSSNAAVQQCQSEQKFTASAAIPLQAFANMSLAAAPAASSPFASAQHQASPFAPSARQHLGFDGPSSSTAVAQAREAASSPFASPFAQQHSPFAAAQQQPAEAAVAEEAQQEEEVAGSSPGSSQCSAAIVIKPRTPPSACEAAYSPFAAVAMTRFDSDHAPAVAGAAPAAPAAVAQPAEQAAGAAQQRLPAGRAHSRSRLGLSEADLRKAASGCSAASAAASLDKSTSGASEPEMFQLDVCERH